MKQPGHNNKRSNGRDRSPSFQFYPGDWLTDPKLNLCSPQTKGVWIDILCHMHLSDEPGFLVFGDIILDANGIQKLSKISPKVFQKVFVELTTFGIIQRDELGRYFSKRMVNDERARQQWREIGKLGGNPKLKKKDNPKDNPKDNTPENRFLTSSSSSSSSSSIKHTNVCLYTHPVTIEIQKNFPSVSKMKLPLTDDQAEKLLAEHSMAEITTILEAMENVPTLSTKYKSTFLTIKNWIKHRKSNDNNNKHQPSGNRNPKPNFDDAISKF
jgi:hypothetical protein